MFSTLQRSFLLSLFCVAVASLARAGSATLWNDQQANPFASGSATISFGSYNATSISVSVQASAYAGSQQGGGRNYSGYAEAVIGSSKTTDNKPEGQTGDPTQVSASNSATFTKGGDGSWYWNGQNVGSSISVSAYAWATGENGVGPGFSSATVSWVEAPSTYNLTIVKLGGGSGTTSGAGTYSAGASASISASPTNGSTFSGWSGAISSTSTSNSLSMNSDKTVYATFEPPQHVNAAPTISWTSNPSSAASGAGYYIGASGYDQDGNLAAVKIDKNGSAYAYAPASGNTGSTGNSDSAVGPTTITYTAWSEDGDGARSGTISHTITIAAANHAPTISWTSTPGTVASGQTFSISASGSDQDGNLSAVKIDKNGGAFGYNSASGSSGTSGNNDSATGPTTISYTAWSEDASGARSGTISQTVTVTAPNAAPTISWTSTPGSAASGSPYTIAAQAADSNGNLSSVTILKNGSAFASGGGGNGSSSSASGNSTDSGAQTVTYTAYATDSSGATSSPISQSVSITVSNTPPTVAWTSAPGTVASGASYSISASAHDNNGNLTGLTITKDGSGFTATGGGTGSDTSASSSSSDTGPKTVTFVATATDSNGATASISQTVTVNSPGNAPIANISASPNSGTNPLTATITWSTSNVTSATVSGSGLSSSNTSGSQSVTLGTGTYTYTINASGPGGSTSASATVTVNPRTYALTVNSGVGGSASGGGTYNEGTVVTINSFPSAGYTANGFTGSVTGSGSSIQVTMNSAKSVNALFTQIQYNLGTAVSPAGAGSVSGGGTYSYGAVASISAAPAANYVFSYYTYAGSAPANTNAASTTVTMTSPTTVTAVFTSTGATTYNLTVNTSGTGTTSPTGTTTYQQNEVATVTATPGGSSTFSGWIGDVTSSNTTINVVMSANRSVTAVFGSKQSQTITFAALGDRVVSSTAFAVAATSSSGLPVTIALITGPATLSGNASSGYQLVVTGAGAVTLQATQAGNSTYLAASPVEQSFNGVAPKLKVRQRGDGITILTGDERDNPTIIKK
jgi:hypothetical protein